MASIQPIESAQHEPITKAADEWPHGLILPPPIVRQRIEEERPRHAPGTFAKHEERLLNEWTIGYVFDSSCLEVIYRPTPRGPEVLAVGSEEVIAFKKATPLDEQLKLETFLP